MKVQATVLVGFQAKTLEEAGALLDEILRPARERDDVDVSRIELTSPPGDHIVTLPPVSSALRSGPHVPSSTGGSNGF
jgi:hypothetical protein